MTKLPPIIGIPSQIFPDNSAVSFGVQESYVNFLLPLGTRPIVIPVIELIDHAADFCALCDGFLIPGGNDISASLYQNNTANPHPANASQSLANNPIPPEPKHNLATENRLIRDRANIALVHAALDYQIPLLGICYGSQIINVALGGTLYKELPTQPINHNPGTAANNHHPITVAPDTPLTRALSTPTISSLTKPSLTFPVNSFHHQGVDQLASSLKPMATAPDQLIEAFYHPAAKFCWGIQWHPERMASAPLSQAIAKSFLAACQNSQPPTGKNSQPVTDQTSQPAPNHA